MEPFVVVEAEIGAKTRNRKWCVFVILEVNLLVLDRAPKPFDENIVEDAAPAIHADPDPGVFEPARKILAISMERGGGAILIQSCVYRLSSHIL